MHTSPIPPTLTPYPSNPHPLTPPTLTPQPDKHLHNTRALLYRSLAIAKSSLVRKNNAEWRGNGRLRLGEDQTGANEGREWSTTLSLITHEELP